MKSAGASAWDCLSSRPWPGRREALGQSIRRQIQVPPHHHSHLPPGRFGFHLEVPGGLPPPHPKPSQELHVLGRIRWYVSELHDRSGQSLRVAFEAAHHARHHAGKLQAGQRGIGLEHPTPVLLAAAADARSYSLLHLVKAVSAPSSGLISETRNVEKGGRIELHLVCM